MTDSTINSIVNDFGFRCFEDDVGSGIQVDASNDDGDAEEDVEEEGHYVDVGSETEDEGVQDPDDQETDEGSVLDGVVVGGFSGSMSGLFQVDGG